MDREQDPSETPDAAANLDPSDVPGTPDDAEEEGFVPPPSDQMASDEATEDEPGYGA